MGVHVMGRVGKIAGVSGAALLLAVSIISGGAVDASSPDSLKGGSPAPVAARAAGEVDASIPAVQGELVRTPIAVDEPAAGGLDDSTETASELLEFIVIEEAAAGAPSWTTAPKTASPATLSPAYASTDPETIARVKDLTARGLECPGPGTFTTSGAPSTTSALGVPGTTTDDLVTFATQYNKIRYENCLPPVKRFIYDACMELRLFWMAESPSPDPLDAWGHIGSTRIDGVPSVGCDGNLAGGSYNTGATVATKWWESLSHRASLYRPGTSTTGVCIALAMTHGGIDEPYYFTRAAARWTTC